MSYTQRNEIWFDRPRVPKSVSDMTGPKSLHNSTDFEFDAFRKRTHLSNTSKCQLHKTRRPYQQPVESIRLTLGQQWIFNNESLMLHIRKPTRTPTPRIFVGWLHPILMSWQHKNRMWRIGLSEFRANFHARHGHNEWWKYPDTYRHFHVKGSCPASLQDKIIKGWCA